MDSLRLVEHWPVDNVAAAVVDGTGRAHTVGDRTRPYRLASVTKLLTASAVHIAHDEGSLDLHAPVAGLGDATGADVLGHCSGLGPDDRRPITAPRRKRIYTNAGYELMADQVSAGAGFGFAEYLQEAVFAPLAMTGSHLDGSAAAGAVATLDDLVSWTTAVVSGRLLSAEATARLVSPHVPELDGVLPGYGRQQPNPWGQGAEIRGTKAPHWTGSTNSGSTWGHFGQRGTFIWHDPAHAVSLIVLTDCDFGDWAHHRWPELSDAVIAGA